MNPATSQPYSCVIIDDNPLSVQILEQYVSRTDSLKLMSSFTDPIDAMAAFWNYGKIDFLFLDIQMDVSGIDVARMLRNNVKFVIFVTAHSSHAVDAVNDGDSFLLKPIGYPKFLDTVDHLIARDRKKKELLS